MWTSLHNLRGSNPHVAKGVKLLCRLTRTYPNPLKVVSNAKSTRFAAKWSSCWSTSRPAFIAASPGLSGDNPIARRSAFTKWTTPSSSGKYRRANVVLPAPFGPAITIQRGVFFRLGIREAYRFRGDLDGTIAFRRASAQDLGRPNLSWSRSRAARDTRSDGSRYVEFRAG